jgi:hypothetical protein
MHYPNNDLWSVRQIEFLEDALKGYEGLEADYYPDEELRLEIPGIASYAYRGILNFVGRDRTVIFEQGSDFGLKRPDIETYLQQLNITFTTHPQ